ncbi:MAG: NhaP-type Na+/H+ or K+/H+ antiporter [Polyangiales bacterium]
MKVLALIVLSGVAIAYALVSKSVRRFPLTGPMLFVGAGMLVSGEALGVLELDVEPSSMHLLAEFTLIFLLFADASKIDVRALRRGLSLPVRLLVIGMPLTILAGVGVGALLFPDWPLASLLVLAALLAPTDAALGQAVVEDERLPEGLRRGLSVESGLNDGIAVPIVVTGIAIASMSEGGGLLFGVLQVTVGPLVGLLVGGVGGRLVQWAERRDLVGESQQAIVGLAMATFAYAAAEAVHGNGFISVFVAGMTIGAVAPKACKALHEFVETEGQVLMYLVFIFVGCLYALPALTQSSWEHVAYAVASLTLVRIVPVALSLIGSDLHRWSRALVAWFGPRGIATIVFAIVALESEALPMNEEIFTVAMLTVVLSVFAHGATAAPAAGLYARFCSPKLDATAVEYESVYQPKENE